MYKKLFFQIKILFRFFLYMLFFVFTGAVSAEEIGDLKSKKIVTFVRVDKDYPPMEFVNSFGKLSGIHIDKIDKAAKAMHVKVIIESFRF